MEEREASQRQDGPLEDVAAIVSEHIKVNSRRAASDVSM